MYGKSSARSPEEYIGELDEPRRTEIGELHKLIRETVPDLAPTMEFGMLGYGPFHYKYKSGREGDWVKIALASQKNYISLYCCAINSNGYVAEGYKDRLPKANIGKSCVRFKRLADLDRDVLRELLSDTAQAEFAQ